MPESKREKKYLAIHRCPTHGLLCVAIDSKKDGGTRLTPSKCCGKWGRVQRWLINDTMMDIIREELFND